MAVPTHSRQSSYATDEDGSSDDDDNYDWSGEEDLVDQENNFQHQMGVKSQRTGCFRRTISLLFGSLIGSILTAGLLSAGPILVYFFWYKPHPSQHRRYVVDNVEAWLFWAAANVVVSWALALIVDVIPIFVRGGVALVWGHVSERIKTRVELYNSVKGTLKPVLYAASAWVSWIILFEHIYKLHVHDNDVTSRAPYTDRLYQVVEFFFFLSLVWCIQRMLSHAIAFTFHRTAFKERIDNLRTSLVVIEHLRDYRPKPKHRAPGRGSRTPVLSALFSSTPGADQSRFTWSRPHSPAGTASESEWDGDAEDVPAANKGKGKKKAKRASKIPATPSENATPGDSPHKYPPTPPGETRPRQSQEESDAVVMHAAKVLKNAVLHDARNLKGKDAEESGLVWDITSSHEAKRLAKRIFYTFKNRRRKFLIPADFEPAYSNAEDAARAFRVFDTDNNGDLSRGEIKSTVLKTYKERRFLSRSIHDVSAALHTLDHILLFFAAVILFFIALPVFNVNVGDSLTSVYTIGIAASFIFKSAASNAFDAIMFLFVTHPYDTGDRCFIDEENLVVKKMGLFATIFTRADGTETYYFNSQLFNKFITNCRRSDKTFENLTMQMEWHTPLEKIDALEHAMNDWLAKEENRWFQPATSITLQNIQYQRYLEVTVGIGHNGNWQDWGLRLTRKTAFHAAVNHFCQQLGIRAYKSALPIIYTDPNSSLYNPLSPMPSHLEVPASPLMEAQTGGGADDMAAPSMNEGAVMGGETVVSTSEMARSAPAGPQPAAVTTARGTKVNFLGFTPTDSDAQISAMRARKSVKSRKAAMRSFGADG
ncbi:Mechanosensitive ion channel-domain-containing protein [Amylostereum chailletii]|nr:Mechanosensitive ion channel-domain-containing protein [Amylostereum chailletii]